MSFYKIRPRSGTKAQWETANTVLGEREIGYELPDEGVGTGLVKMKMGNGATPWNDLPYAILPQGGTGNLLINGDFQVNQRGYKSVTSDGSTPKYLVDRWCVFSGSDGKPRTIEQGSSGAIIVSGNGTDGFSALCQILESLNVGTYALSAKVDGVVYSATLNWNNAYTEKDFGDGVSLFLSNNNNFPTFGIAVEIAKKTRIVVEWAKLEKGAIATPFVPRLYAEELGLCQRYYQVYYDIVLCSIPDSTYTEFSGFLFPNEMRIKPSVSYSYLSSGSWVDILGTLKTTEVSKYGLKYIVLNASASRVIYGAMFFDAEIY